MEADVACRKTSEIDMLRRVEEMVDDVVTAIRNHGFTRECAVAQAAIALDLPPRRIKSILYGEPLSLGVEEYQRLCSRFLDHLDAEAERLVARAAALRARRKQMELAV